MNPGAGRARDTAPAAPRRVLVVDDDPVNQMIATTVLENLHCAVDQASHGVAAVDKCTRHDYDAIIMDLDMPQMSGLEAARRIRNFLEARQRRIPPITAWTANHSEQLKQQCFEAGMRKFLLKPTRIHTLREEFRDLLQMD